MAAISYYSRVASNVWLWLALLALLGGYGMVASFVYTKPKARFTFSTLECRPGYFVTAVVSAPINVMDSSDSLASSLLWLLSLYSLQLCSSSKVEEEELLDVLWGHRFSKMNDEYSFYPANPPHIWSHVAT